jgi:hypothetical protein
VSRLIRVVIVSMYEKVIERLLWNTAQHEYSTYSEVKEISLNDWLRLNVGWDARRHTRYRVKRTSACGGCLGDHRR